jgi:hypothetical protein
MKNNTLFLTGCLLLFLFIELAKGQSVSISKEEMGKVFEKTNTWFRATPAYSMNVTHASFENYTIQVPVEKASGYFKKNGNNYHSFLLGIHTIQNSQYKIVIDTAQKVIVVANPDQLAWLTYTQEDYKVLLKNATATRMSKTGRYTFYRVELPANNPIGAYEFLIDEKGLAREINWYYNDEVKKDENDASSAVKPRMSISFSGYEENPSLNFTEMFSETPYFSKKDNKLIVAEKYTKFKLLDQRISK